MSRISAIIKTTKKSSTANRRSAIKSLLAGCFLILGFSSVAAQTTSSNRAVAPFSSEKAITYSAATDLQLDLVLWFMGTKQVSPMDFHDEGVRSGGKKQFINLGMTPNRILSNSFMKKVINYDNTVA